MKGLLNGLIIHYRGPTRCTVLGWSLLGLVDTLCFSYFSHYHNFSSHIVKFEMKKLDISQNYSIRTRTCSVLLRVDTTFPTLNLVTLLAYDVYVKYVTYWWKKRVFSQTFVYLHVFFFFVPIRRGGSEFPVRYGSVLDDRSLRPILK